MKKKIQDQLTIKQDVSSSSSSSSSSNEEEDTGPADHKTGADCWENGDFIETDECDTGGLPLCSGVSMRQTLLTYS